MTPLEAVRAITEVQRTDPQLTIAVIGACRGKGCESIYEFAEQFPDDVVLMAEQIVGVYEQVAPTNDR